MGISMQPPMQAMEKYFSAVLHIVSEELKRTLKYLGEQSIKKARDRSGQESWFDQTGNLRSSIGYAIYEHGRKEIESAFQIVKKGSEGTSEGRKMVEELASMYSQSYALVVVAAMNYADYVEAMDNKDVLASTELWAKGVVDSYMEKTKNRILNRISKLK